MKKFGHKYDGAEEQEQMLNMLNIGLGAFLLYLFHKNFGKKMRGGDSWWETFKISFQENVYEIIFIILSLSGAISSFVMADETECSNIPYIIFCVLFILIIIYLGIVIRAGKHLFEITSKLVPAQSPTDKTEKFTSQPTEPKI